MLVQEKIMRPIVLGLALIITSHLPTALFASEVPTATCQEILSNDTFRDALTRNDGFDWVVLNSAREGHQLHGIACDKAIIDAYFVASGWVIGGMTTYDKHIGPYGRPSDRYFRDTVFGYVHCRKKTIFTPITKFFKRRCGNGIRFVTFQGKITHIAGGGKK